MSRKYYTDYVPNDSIYCPVNKYGYKLNINHVDIFPLYMRYKRWKGIGINIPLSDSERHEFETYVIEKYLNTKQNTSTNN